MTTSLVKIQTFLFSVFFTIPVLSHSSSTPAYASTLSPALPVIAQAHPFGNGKQHVPPGFRTRFQSVFTSLATGIMFSNCLDPKARKPLDLAYFGIAPDNIHLQESDRKNLNSLAQEAIRFSGIPLNPNDAQNISSLTRLAANSSKGQSDVSAALKRIFNAPLRLIIETRRPAIHVIQLTVKLYGRASSGAYECNRTQTINVKLPGYEVTGHLTANENFVDLAGAYKDSLLKSREEIRKANSLLFETRFDMAGKCDFISQSREDFKTAYFALRDTEFAGIMTSEDWPALLSGRRNKAHSRPETNSSAQASPLTMRVRFSLAKRDPRVVHITLGFYQGARLINERSYKAITDSAKIAGCSPSSPGLLAQLYENQTANQLKFSITTDKPVFRVGTDKVSLEVFAGEPLFFYCLYVGADETAYIAYPWKFEQLQRPWPRGQSLRYPAQFGLADTLVYQRPVRELFGCYASRNRLPDHLETRWIEAHPFNKGGNGPQKELTKGEVRELTGQLQHLNNTGRVFVWLKSRWAQ